MRKKVWEGCDVLIGNCLETLKTLPNESIHSCITSPPYYALRDYGTTTWVGGDENCEHEGKMISNNRNFIQKEGRGSNKASLHTGDCIHCGAKREDAQIGLEESPKQFVEKLVEVFREVKRVLHPSGTLWLNIGDTYNNNLEEYKSKDLIGIPWMLAFALRSDGWYLRQDIIWAKPNPMPEPGIDRCTRSHEHIFLLSKSKSYFFDHEAIREKAETNTLGESTRNKRDVWQVNVKPYPEAHFAVFPPELIEPCILAGTSQGGCCSECFAPYNQNLSSCDCDAEQMPCTVLDPFGGSGTTAGVALKHKRNAILCELNDSYIDLMAGRIKEITGLYDGQKTLFTLFREW